MFKARQYLVFFFLMILLFSFLFRLFFLQVISYERFDKMASRQHNAVSKIEPRRGTIFDRNLEPLAINLEVPSIFCDPREVKDPEKTAKVLSDILGIKERTILDRIKRDKAFVWISRKVNSKTARRIKELDLEGIHFLTESKRNYPNDNMASHIMGFVGVDNEGLEGLELLWDQKLRGKPGWRHIIRDARRRTVIFNEEDSIPPQNGYNIVLTIDAVIQFIVEEELEKMARKYNVSGASCIVMDPVTGKILAMANWPDYDLNNYNNTPRKNMKNAAVCDVYEPGSVFKIITASAALNEGVVDLSDEFYCEKGEYRVGGRILHDYHKYGDLTFKEVIGKSSNIGTVKVAEILGEEKVYDYVKDFGFGKSTGVDLPGEVGGISRPVSIWSKSDITTIPIGQGIAVTTLQLAQAVSVIANGGYLMKPYIVDSITTMEGGVYTKFQPEEKRRVLLDETCLKMKEIMHYVVTDGTGRRARSKKYNLCGKTGTAQMVNPQGGYYENKYNASFVGFGPLENPQIVIVVTAKDPYPVHFGGSVAGPAFKKIAERTLQYLGEETSKDKNE